MRSPIGNQGPAPRQSLPAAAARLISVLNGPVGNEGVLGDFEEEYRILREESGAARAGFWLSSQIIKMTWGITANHIHWQGHMLGRYGRSALRNAMKGRVFTFVNLAGLSTGLVGCILIAAWIADEISYDKFHRDAGSIYQVFSKRVDSGSLGSTPLLLGPTLVDDYPGVGAATRYHWLFETPFFTRGDKSYKEGRLRFVDPSFLGIFTFPLVSGDAATALDGPRSLVITEDAAAKYFPGEDPLGKTLTMNNKFEFTVTGLMKNLPNNSTLGFEMLAPIDFLISFHSEGGDWYTAWSNLFAMTFIRLEAGTDPAQLEKSAATIISDHGGDPGMTTSLLPFTKRYMTNFSDIRYVYIFGAVAAIILLMACFNYVNLATARSAGRAKEIALRKTIGAGRRDVIVQLLVESTLISLAAGVVSVAAARLLIPLFNNLAGKEILFDYRLIVPAALLFSLFAGLLGGAYPALLISSFRPATILRGKVGSGLKNPVLRKSLVVFQFSVTLVLMTGVVVVHSQLDTLRRAETGYDRGRLISLRLGGGAEKHYRLIKEQLLYCPQIKGVTGTGAAMPYFSWQLTGLFWEGRGPDPVSINYNVADNDFIETMGMEILQGSSFLNETAADSGTSKYLVNEKMASLMGVIPIVGAALSNLDEPGEIIGVMKDFNFNSPVEEIGPLVIKLEPVSVDNMLIRAGGDIPGAILFIEEKWKELLPGHPFDYTFLDEDFDRGFMNIRRRGMLFNAFTILASVIASLGLFGLASFTAGQRTREIGIRKVLGASNGGILVLLAREFAACLGISALIACPAAYILMERWLDDFACRTPIHPWMIALPVLAAVIISLVAAGRQSLRAAAAAPVDSLKYE